MSDARVIRLLRRGTVIPAHPLALTAARKLDERRQRALTRYYLDAGAGGIAVGVHTTQFGIRDPKVALYRPVLELAAETATEWEAAHHRPVIRVAGVIGRTRQAVREAETARDLGYHMGLLGLGALARSSDAQLIAHARRVGEVIPLMGFYLQPAVGGRRLAYSFWRRFVELPSVVAIKIAPFNRYDTLDVIRAVADAGRQREIALYTGNDDSIVMDLVTPYPGGARMVGGLLGHWAFWTRRAVQLLEAVHRAIAGGGINYYCLKLGVILFFSLIILRRILVSWAMKPDHSHIEEKSGWQSNGDAQRQINSKRSGEGKSGTPG